MKITDSLLAQLQNAVTSAGGASEFARRTGVDAANISRYLSGKVHSISDDNWSKLAPVLDRRLPHSRSREGVIANTAALRECIKDGMLQAGLRTAADLNRRIGYDSPGTVERLLAGKLEWFPDVLSMTLAALGIDYDAAPLSAAERALLTPSGMFAEGGRLVRPIPLVEWANAAGQLEMLASGGAALLQNWDPEETETVLSPVGGRQDTIAFRVAGVSMEPRIHDGDIILVEPALSPNDVLENKIVVAKFSDRSRFDDCVVCKRFHRQNNGSLLLTSDNPEGRIIPCSPADFAWLGIVVRKICDL